MSLVRVSTNRVAKHKRALAIQELYASVANIRLDPLTDEPLFVRSSLRQLPNVSIAQTQCNPCQAARNSSQLSDGNDNIVLSVITGGNVIVDLHNDRQIVCQSGDVYVGPNHVPSRRIFTENTSFFDISIPRDLIAPYIADPNLSLSQHMLGNVTSPALRMLAGYVQTLTHQELPLTPSLARLAANHIQDLIIAALGTKSDVVPELEQRSLQAARLEAIKGDIMAHLSDPLLTLDAIAHRHNVSVQYARALFRSDGTTFTDFLRQERIKLACRMLQDASLAHRNISTIAFDCGFNDLSYFNRLFRRYFGMTPSDMRYRRATMPTGSHNTGGISI